METSGFANSLLLVNIVLTHLGRVTHICVSKLTIIVSDNGLSPGRRQAIISTNTRMLLIGPLGTNFSETSIEIHTFSFKKMHLKMSSAKWRPFYLGLNVLMAITRHIWWVLGSMSHSNQSGDNTMVAGGLVPTWHQGIYNHLLGSSQMYISVIPKLFNVYMLRSLRHTLSWWRHQMETFSALLAIFAGNSPVPGEFPTQKPMTRSFDVFPWSAPDKRLSKQWWGWWFETPSCPLWRQCNVFQPTGMSQCIW